MSILSYPLTLDTSRKNAFKTVLAQQYDTHSRELVITLSNDNVQFIADSTMTAVLNGTYEDETPILPLACTINEDGTVTAPITSMALTQTSGLYSLTVTIYSSDSERLGVFPFTLEVEAGSTVPLDSFDDESVELLTELISETRDAIHDAEQASVLRGSVTPTETGATISVTDQYGTTEADIHNGTDGTDGRDGTDGFSPIVTVTKAGDTATISITDANGTTTASVKDGRDGSDGTDGTSAYASVTKSGDTATITCTDAHGTTTATVKDGSDGVNGIDGVDGTSAFASVSKSGDTATITCTDVNGTTTATVKDGTDGTDGADGISPTAVVTKSGDVVTISITDREGTTTATVQDASALEGTINTAPVPDKNSVTWLRGYLNGGEFVPSTNTQRTTDFIELKPSIPYNLEIGYTSSTSTLPRVCCVYDSHWQYVRAVPNNAGYFAPLVLNASTDEKYIRVNHNNGDNLDYFRIYEPSVGYQGELALKSTLPIPQDDKYDVQFTDRKDGAYIHPRRPVLAITIDGTHPNTPTMLAVAEKYGIRASVAIPYNETFSNFSYSTIKGWQDAGHEILMHTSQVLDSNYDLDAGNKIIIEGAKRMKDWGFRTFGLVASSGNLDAKFLPAVKHSFEYGATTGNTHTTGTPYFLYNSSEPYTLHRYGMQESTVEDVENGITATINANGFCWLYGHARNDGTERNFTPENFETILKYAIDKNIDIKTPYEAIKDYYSPRITNVHLTATIDSQTSLPVITSSMSFADIVSAITRGDVMNFVMDATYVGIGIVGTSSYTYSGANILINHLINTDDYVIDITSNGISLNIINFATIQ